jgi:hypothetical protein
MNLFDLELPTDELSSTLSLTQKGIFIHITVKYTKWAILISDATRLKDARAHYLQLFPPPHPHRPTFPLSVGSDVLSVSNPSDSGFSFEASLNWLKAVVKHEF